MEKVKGLEKYITGENGIEYTLGEDGLYYPDLKLPEAGGYNIGKNGLMNMDDLKYYFIFIQIYAALCSLNIKTICANPFSILKKAERLSALPITIIYQLFQHNFLCCVPHIIYKSNPLHKIR